MVPTPYQRDLSDSHVKRLAEAMDKLGRFMDPVVAVPADEGMYWTPNGNHRLAALRALGARTVVALVVPEPEVAHRILVLNTEKAHNVRERALEVIRLAEALAELDDRAERSYETEFEEPALLTLGCCYQRNGRFSGGAYAPILKRMESFLAQKLSNALVIRRERAERLLELDAAVAEAMKRAQGARLRQPVSPGLRAGAHQPAPVHAEAGPEGRLRRDDGEDARFGEEVRHQPGARRPGRPERRGAGHLGLASAPGGNCPATSPPYRRTFRPTSPRPAGWWSGTG